MAGGDTGAPRTGGSAADDSFTKREQAAENFAIREREKAKLQELTAKLEDQQKHLDDLKKHVSDISDKHKAEEKK